MLSTDVKRTLQSGYSELQGFAYEYAKNNTLRITHKQRSSSRGTPPFNIRAQAEIEASLKDKAIVDGFVDIPIKTYIQKGNWQDGVASETCQFAQDVDADRW